MYNDPNQQQPPGQPPYGIPPQQPPYGASSQQAPYGQAPYGEIPQYGQVPNYVAPPPQKKSKKTLWIILGIIGAILVLGCGVCGLFLAGVIKIGSQVAGPTLAITSYYQNLKTQNFAQAYTYLDPQSLTVQGQTVTVDLYAKAEAAVDQQFGPVTNFTITNIQTQADTATITVRETRNQIRTITYTLRRVGNTWKISGVNNGTGLPSTS